MRSGSVEAREKELGQAGNRIKRTAELPALKKYSAIMQMPVSSANMEADRPLLPVSLNSGGKQAAPTIEGMMMHREYVLNSALLPST